MLIIYYHYLLGIVICRLTKRQKYYISAKLPASDMPALDASVEFFTSAGLLRSILSGDPVRLD